MPAITSRQHAIVKQFRAAARGTAPHVLLDGWHLLAEAVDAGMDVQHVAVRGIPTPEHRELLDRAQALGAAYSRVSAPVMDALTPVRTSTGVAALAVRPTVETSALTQPAPGLVIAGFGIQDPGNVGAMLRSAEAGGATGALFDAQCADPWGWKSLRASMGSAFRLPTRRDDNAMATIAAWRSQGLSIVAAHPRGAIALTDIDFSEPTVVLVGAEGPGLPEEILDLAGVRVAIPMRPPVESLNVAVATALIVYEALRQRTTEGLPPLVADA